MTSYKKFLPIFLAVLALWLAQAIFTSCGQKGRMGGQIVKTAGDDYSIGPLEGADEFSALTPGELELDSTLKLSPWFKNGFKNNRTRIYLEEFKNSSRERIDPIFEKGAPAPCIGTLNGDTIQIKTWLGFFGGYVFLLKIYGDQFNFSYVPTMDQEIYKANLTDSTFKREITVNPRMQGLKLNSKPAFRTDEQVTGVVKFTTANYFVKANPAKPGAAIDTVFNSGKIYFTCTINK